MVSDPETVTPGDFDRDEAARLLAASLRSSRFLLVIRREDGINEIRNYGVDYPDTVPVIETADTHLQDVIGNDLRKLLPHGGVICVPPDDSTLCVQCRVGVRTHVTAGDQELCTSCAVASHQTTGIAPKEIVE